MSLPQPILRRAHINACRTVLHHDLAGEPLVERKTGIEALDAFAACANGGAFVGFSRLQMRLLWDAIENGAEAVLQKSSGWSSMQKAAFREAANRLREAGDIDRPRF